MTNQSIALTQLAAKQSIAEVLYHYCRGLDWMDRQIADTVWHPDGTAEYGVHYNGSSAGFLDFVCSPVIRTRCPA